jgi:hypothetical protein
MGNLAQPERQRCDCMLPWNGRIAMSALAVEARIHFGQCGLLSPVQRIGFWSAVLAAISSSAFTIGVVLGMLGVLARPWDAAASLVPSLLLAPSFVALLVSVHYSVPAEKKIWSHAAVVFACMYAALCAMAYVVELSVVQPLVLRGQADRVALLTLAQYGTQPNTVFTAIDGLGYGFMSLACLFAAQALGSSRLERWIRWLFVATGVLGVPSMLTYFVNPAFISVAALWGITVPAFCILLAVYFRRAGRSLLFEVSP